MSRPRRATTSPHSRALRRARPGRRGYGVAGSVVVGVTDGDGEVGDVDGDGEILDGDGDGFLVWVGFGDGFLA